MDDVFAINVAKTEFRDAFNLGDTARILATADPDLVNFSDEHPSEFRKSGLEDFEARLKDLFNRFSVKLSVIVVEIRVEGNMAYDYGWHELTFTPKTGGETVERRDRYVDIWRKNPEGQWKLLMYMDNRDVPDPFLPAQPGPDQPISTDSRKSSCTNVC